MLSSLSSRHSLGQ